MIDKKLIETIQRLKNMAEDALPSIQDNIDSIIERKEQDPNIVQRELDYILNLVQIGIGDSEFKRLNDYLRTIDFKGANYYDKEYQEIIDDNK